MGSSKKGVDPEGVANFVQNEVFHRYAGVFEVVTDCGPEISSLFSALCKSSGATHVHTSARNPQANGQVERYMQVVKAALRKCADENPTERHIYVSGICWDIRNNLQESIGMSPYKALFGREPILPAKMRFSTLTTLVRPDLYMEETAEQKDFVLNKWRFLNLSIRPTSWARREFRPKHLLAGVKKASVVLIF
jgi:hypothetical protein